MSSENALAEMWIEVEGVRLDTITDSNDQDIAMIDSLHSDHVTPYTLCVRIKQVNPLFNCTRVHQVLIDGRQVQEKGSVSRPNQSVCRIKYCSNGERLGFAPFPAASSTKEGDPQILHHRLGTIEVKVESVLRMFSYTVEAASASKPMLPNHQQAMADYNGLSTLGVQSVSAGRTEPLRKRVKTQAGPLKTSLKLRYGNRHVLLPHLAADNSVELPQEAHDDGESSDTDNEGEDSDDGDVYCDFNLSDSESEEGAVDAHKRRIKRSRQLM